MSTNKSTTIENPEESIIPKFLADEQSKRDKLLAFAVANRAKIDSDDLSERFLAKAILPFTESELEEYESFTAEDRARRSCDSHFVQNAPSYAAYLEAKLTDRMKDKTSFVASVSKKVAEISEMIFSTPSDQRHLKYAEREKRENELEALEVAITHAHHKIQFFLHEPSLETYRSADAAVSRVNFSTVNIG